MKWKLPLLLLALLVVVWGLPLLAGLVIAPPATPNGAYVIPPEPNAPPTVASEYWQELQASNSEPAPLSDADRLLPGRVPSTNRLPSLPIGIPTPAALPPDTDETEQPAPFTMMFTGDVLLDGSVAGLIARQGLLAPLSEQLLTTLAQADWTGINLEMPFSERGTPAPEKQFTFRGKPEYMELLTHMGVDFCALGNNHTLDYGRDAFLDTLELLEQHDILYAGGGRTLEESMRPAVYELGGRSVAVLSASRVIPYVSWYARSNKSGLLATYDPANLLSAIESAKTSHDLCVVFVHWGVEGSSYPEDYQRKLARQYIDAGADLVVGSHPHVLQGFEFYNDKLIAYSLGNFIFTDNAKNTAVLQLTVDAENRLAYTLLPCRIENRSTKLLEGEAAQALFNHLTNLSYQVALNDEGALIPAKSQF